MRNSKALRIVWMSGLFLAGASPSWTQTPAPVEFYRLVPGFIAETKNQWGQPAGTGFATPNPWGQDTAYLLSTNAKGQRTWRIENFLPNADNTTSQGSSMYLFEGSQRALLVDTAQNTKDTPGKDDLKTIVRYLLGHNNDGSPKSNPVDFVVANTHSHGDHTGKNRDMSDRTLYYPDLDWPANAPSNWVPIREGGGVTAHGTSPSQIDLGDRTIFPVDIHQHTRGSMGYLDKENQMVATGDSIGSGFVYAQGGLITVYAQAVHHLQDAVRPYDHLTVLPAHFYQNAFWDRRKDPINGKPVDKQYIDDEVTDADGILSGAVVGEPYRTGGRNTVWARVNSAQICYSLANLYPPDQADKNTYHAIVIPGRYRTTPENDGVYAKIDNIKSGFYLIRDYANNSLYLIVGSDKALLVGTGTGTPGIAAFASRLAGRVPLEVIVTSEDPGQIGGLAQFASNKVYLPKGVSVPAAGLKNVTAVGAGDSITLGKDSEGRALTIQVFPLAGHSANGITLLDASDRILLSGDALGTQGPDAGLVLEDDLARFAAALKGWRTQTSGKFDLVYTAHNFQWYTDAAYVDQLESAAAAGLSGDASAVTDSARVPGRKLIKSKGAADVVASIVLRQ